MESALANTGRENGILTQETFSPGRQIRSGVLLALRLPVDLGEIVFLGHCVGPLDPLHALQVPSGVYLTPNGFISASKDGFDFLDSEGFALLRLDDQMEQPGELVGIGVDDAGGRRRVPVDALDGGVDHRGHRPDTDVERPTLASGASENGREHRECG